jgi:hypothetical protein
MEKYIGTYQDGHRIAVWSIDRNMAQFHLKDGERLHGRLITVTKVRKAA